jgi:hypothetical protein
MVKLFRSAARSAPVRKLTDEKPMKTSTRRSLDFRLATKMPRISTANTNGFSASRQCAMSKACEKWPGPLGNGRIGGQSIQFLPRGVGRDEFRNGVNHIGTIRV